MGLRHSLEVVRRRKWSIVACGVVVGVLLGGFLALRAPSYSATARVRTPNDLGPSRAIADRAVALIPGAQSSALRSAVRVRRIGASDLFAITATSADRSGAARIANAFARSYIEAERVNAVSAERRSVADLDGQMATLQTRLQDLDAQVSRAKTPSAATTAQLASATAQYEALQNRRQELQAGGGLPGVRVELVAPASGGGTIANTGPLRAALIAGLLALVLAAGVVWTREVLDERVRSSDEIARITGLPVLAELPRDQLSKRDRTRLAVAASPRSPLSEATRALRTSIELWELEHHRPTLLVTSAVPGEGKSLVSANLAAAYALAGYRTVLVDGDLRTPSLSSVFGTYPARLISSRQAVHGLSGLVTELAVPGADRQTLEKAALLRTPIDNLLFLPAGPEPANPSELLDSRAMGVLLADLGGIADIVIIDSPPLLPVSDAVGLARLADGVVLVAAVGESHRSSLRRSREILAAHPRVLGVVANKVAPSATYAPYRRVSAPTPSPALTSSRLGVVHTLEIPTPPTGSPDANGDIWIDLSEEPDEQDQPFHAGTLQLSDWGR